MFKTGLSTNLQSIYDGDLLCEFLNVEIGKIFFSF